MSDNNWNSFFDNWFGYTTKRTVYIRDRWLGFIYYSLVALVVLYIFGVQILANNEQFLLSPVEGISRMKVSHPVRGFCDIGQPDCKSDYRSLEVLPYCNVYKGNDPADRQADCRFEDATTIMPNGEIDNKVFIPTAVEIVTERRACKPGPENHYTCENEYEELPGSDCLRDNFMCRTRGNLKDQFYFVADTKNFEIGFTSSYEQGSVHGTSLDHPAYYQVCASRLKRANQSHHWAQRLQHNQNWADDCDDEATPRLRLPCAPGVRCNELRDFDLLADSGVNEAIDKTKKGIHDLNKKIKPQTRTKFLQHGAMPLDTSGADLKSKPVGYDGHIDDGSTDIVGKQRQWQSAYGDVFKLDRLMELAGSDLDLNYNFDNWTLRESGTALEVSAVYYNLHPFKSTFGFKDPGYYYKVKELPLPYVSRRLLAKEQPADYPETRRYEVRHGVLIWFKVEGKFGNFSSTYLLIYLVTAFALIGAASSVTDLVAIYIHKRKANYFHLKYHVSGDFSDKWQCEVCGFWNFAASESCKGLPMWECQQQAAPCGACKPGGKADG